MVKENAEAARRWDAEYGERSKYIGEEGLPFVGDILGVLEAEGLTAGKGLYVGCGNGRNYIPLFEAGLDITGIDISATALEQLEQRCPKAAGNLALTSFTKYVPPRPLDYLVSIQTFQHGTRAEVAEHFAKTRAILRPRGLFFLRVNSTSTEIFHEHTPLEISAQGGKTVRYLDGPKKDLAVHFFTGEEIEQLTSDKYWTIMPPREVVMERLPPASGTWVQWEAIYRKI